MNDSAHAPRPATPRIDRQVVELAHPLGRLRLLVEALVAAELSATTMVVALALAGHCDRDGVAYRSVRDLALDLRRSPSAVHRDVARLKAAGLVDTVPDNLGRAHRRGYRFAAMSMYRHRH